MAHTYLICPNQALTGQISFNARLGTRVGHFLSSSLLPLNIDQNIKESETLSIYTGPYKHSYYERKFDAIPKLCFKFEYNLIRHLKFKLRSLKEFMV